MRAGAHRCLWYYDSGVGGGAVCVERKGGSGVKRRERECVMGE